jgi:dinuclear metal center YbgI/SA1388 family protein
MKIREIIKELELIAPSSYQEEYDNSGLICGNKDWEFKGSVLCLDSTEDVIDEAIKEGVNLVIAHHPILFRGLKRITGSHYTERAVIKAIKHDIAIYAIHTNLDNVRAGVNEEFANRIGLNKKGRSILMPKASLLLKLEVLCPKENTKQVQEAIWAAGAGRAGQYERCSFKTEGEGQFKPFGTADPHIGELGKDELVNEAKLEFILAEHLSQPVLEAMRNAHPYEEVAYFLHPLKNVNQEVGSGIVGNLEKAMPVEDFLKHVKEKMSLKFLKHTEFSKGKIERVALMGGSGIFGLEAAKRAGAQAYITADVKYHDYFEVDGDLLLVDIGHYESEQYTRELLQRVLLEKFPTFAHLLTRVNTNPVKYL